MSDVPFSVTTRTADDLPVSLEKRFQQRQAEKDARRGITPPMPIVPPMPVDNSAFSEEERTEAFRREVMGQLERQTRSLESVRSILVFFTALWVLGVVVAFIAILTARPWLG